MRQVNRSTNAFDAFHTFRPPSLPPQGLLAPLRKQSDHCNRAGIPTNRERECEARAPEASLPLSLLPSLARPRRGRRSWLTHGDFLPFALPSLLPALLTLTAPSPPSRVSQWRRLQNREEPQGFRERREPGNWPGQWSGIRHVMERAASAKWRTEDGGRGRKRRSRQS